MSSILAPTSVPPRPPRDPDLFRYGWRDIERTLPDGTLILDRQPLTLDDVLHPQEGDVIPDNPIHESERRYLTDVCEARVAGRDDALVLSDCLIEWDQDDLRDNSPDLSLIFGVVKRVRGEGKFYVAREKARPLLLLELVSPSTRVNDVVHKPPAYYRVGVQWYVYVDQEEEDGPRQIVGHRRGPTDWERLDLDAQGRLWLEPLGIWLGLKDNRVVCYDGVTGKELEEYKKIALALQEAEQHRHREAEARRLAEQREREHAKAREETEERLRQLEAEVNRLRSGTK